MRPRPTLVIATVIVLATAGAALAYGTPKLAHPTCIARAQDYLRAHPVQGLTFYGQRVVAPPVEIAAMVEGPFEAKVHYALPRGLHATVYEHRCSAWPWQVSLGERTSHSTM